MDPGHPSGVLSFRRARNGMRRREFITALGGMGATTWPLAARAQQPAMPVVGFLHAQSPDAFTEPLRGFRLGLRETGYVEGETVAIEYRWAESRMDRLTELVAELVHLKVDVMCASGGQPSSLGGKEA